MNKEEKETYCDDRRLNSHNVCFFFVRLNMIKCVCGREVCVCEKRVCMREWCVCEWKKVSECVCVRKGCVWENGACVNE